MTKRLPYRKIVYIIISILMAGVLVGLIMYKYSHRYVAGRVTFQEYAPTYLPEGVHITEKSIDASYVPSAMPSHTTILSIELNNGFVANGENLRNFNYTCPAGYAVNEVCFVYTTPGSKRYVLTTNMYANDFHERSVGQRLEWLEGETYVTVGLDSKNDRGYSQDTLNKIVDSFKPVKYKNLPYHYYDRSSV